jgi:hypothetical protein
MHKIFWVSYKIPDLKKWIIPKAEYFMRYIDKISLYDLIESYQLMSEINMGNFADQWNEDLKEVTARLTVKNNKLLKERGRLRSDWEK